MKLLPEFSIWLHEDGWVWTLRAGNGRPMACSTKAYKSERAALNSAIAMKELTSDARYFVIRDNPGVNCGSLVREVKP